MYISEFRVFVNERRCVLGLVSRIACCVIKLAYFNMELRLLLTLLLLTCASVTHATEFIQAFEDFLASHYAGDNTAYDEIRLLTLGHFTQPTSCISSALAICSDACNVNCTAFDQASAPITSAVDDCYTYDYCTIVLESYILAVGDNGNAVVTPVFDFDPNEVSYFDFHNASFSIGYQFYGLYDKNDFVAAKYSFNDPCFTIYFQGFVPYVTDEWTDFDDQPTNYDLMKELFYLKTIMANPLYEDLDKLTIYELVGVNNLNSGSDISEYFQLASKRNSRLVVFDYTDGDKQTLDIDFSFLDNGVETINFVFNLNYTEQSLASFNAYKHNIHYLSQIVFNGSPGLTSLCAPPNITGWRIYDTAVSPFGYWTLDPPPPLSLFPTGCDWSEQQTIKTFQMLYATNVEAMGLDHDLSTQNPGFGGFLDIEVFELTTYDNTDRLTFPDTFAKNGKLKVMQYLDLDFTYVPFSAKVLSNIAQSVVYIDFHGVAGFIPTSFFSSLTGTPIITFRNRADVNLFDNSTAFCSNDAFGATENTQENVNIKCLGTGKVTTYCGCTPCFPYAGNPITYTAFTQFAQNVSSVTLGNNYTAKNDLDRLRNSTSLQYNDLWSLQDEFDLFHYLMLNQRNTLSLQDVRFRNTTVINSAMRPYLTSLRTITEAVINYSSPCESPYDIDGPATLGLLTFDIKNYTTTDGDYLADVLSSGHGGGMLFNVTATNATFVNNVFGNTGMRSLWVIGNNVTTISAKGMAPPSVPKLYIGHFENQYLGKMFASSVTSDVRALLNLYALTIISCDGVDPVFTVPLNSYGDYSKPNFPTRKIYITDTPLNQHFQFIFSRMPMLQTLVMRNVGLNGTVDYRSLDSLDHLTNLDLSDNDDLVGVLSPTILSRNYTHVFDISGTQIVANIGPSSPLCHPPVGLSCVLNYSYSTYDESCSGCTFSCGRKKRC